MKLLDVGFRRLGVGNDQAQIGGATGDLVDAIQGCPQAVVFDTRLFLVVRAHGAEKPTVGDAATVDNVAAAVDDEVDVFDAQAAAFEGLLHGGGDKVDVLRAGPGAAPLGLCTRHHANAAGRLGDDEFHRWRKQVLLMKR